MIRSIQSRRSSAPRSRAAGDSRQRSGTGRADASTQSPPSRVMLVRWLLQVTRPVLSPLLGSTLCRVTDLLCGVVLFSLGAYAVARVGLAMASGAPVPVVWPVRAVMAGLSLLKAALRYAEQFLGHLVAFKALELLRGQIFRSLITRSPGSARRRARATCCRGPPRTWTGSRSSSPTPSLRRSAPSSSRSRCSRSSVSRCPGW